jgi:hypothetical protein
MQWDASSSGGFTSGEAWLPPVDPEQTNVEAQRDDPRSMLSLVRDLLTVRRLLGEGLELIESSPGVLAYRRGDHMIAINTTPDPQPAALAGELVLETRPGTFGNGVLGPHAAAISRG